MTQIMVNGVARVEVGRISGSKIRGERDGGKRNGVLVGVVIPNRESEYIVRRSNKHQKADLPLTSRSNIS